MTKGGKTEEFIPPNVNLRVTARVHQGDLAQVLTDRGWSYQTAADYIGITRTYFDNLINLRFDKLPKNFLDRFTREQEQKLMELTGRIPEDLWPEWLQEQDLRRREVFVEITPQMLAGQSVRALLPENIDKGVQYSELVTSTAEALDMLTNREQQVVRAIYFSEEFDVEEVGFFGACKRIAPQFKVSAWRIQAIAQKALRKLRHPSRSRKLKPHLNLLDTPNHKPQS